MSKSSGSSRIDSRHFSFRFATSLTESYRVFATLISSLRGFAGGELPPPPAAAPACAAGCFLTLLRFSY